MEEEGKLIVKLDVGRRSYLTIFGLRVIFTKLNSACVVIFAEVPVFIFSKIRGGGEEINCTLHINMLHTKKTNHYGRGEN